MVTKTPRATLTIDEAAQALGIGRTLIYEEVRRTGQLAGVRVLRVGKRWLVPRQAFERALAGETATGPTDDAA